MQLQLDHLYPHRQKLQKKHGEKSLFAIHGAGCIDKPDICFVFMNPTGKNISSTKHWKGIRAARLGTKNVWKIFLASNIISQKTFQYIQILKTNERTEEFAEKLYAEIAEKKIYITNLAKCTQIDARPLSDKVFKDYLACTLEELAILQPKHIITLGNQVSSVLLEKNIKVSEYKPGQYEILTIKNKEYRVYPVFYPVGQWTRNMPQAIKSIKKVSQLQ